jgi:hypothetical protein
VPSAECVRAFQFRMPDTAAHFFAKSVVPGTKSRRRVHRRAARQAWLIVRSANLLACLQLAPQLTLAYLLL